MKNPKKQHQNMLKELGSFKIIYGVVHEPHLKDKLIKYGNWLNALCKGDLKPFTYRQIKFTHCCEQLKTSRGSVTLQLEEVDSWDVSSLEKVFLKHKILEREDKNARNLKISSSKRSQKVSKTIKQAYKPKKKWLISQKSKSNSKKTEPIIKDKPLPKQQINYYELNHPIEYYFQNIIGLNEDEINTIIENFNEWYESVKKYYNSDLNDNDKKLIEVLNSDIPPSEGDSGLFHYFFHQVKNLNLRGKMTFKPIENTFYSNDMIKKMRSITMKNTIYNHKVYNR